MTEVPIEKELYALLREPHHPFSKADIKALFAKTDRDRVKSLAAVLKADLAVNLPNIYGRRKSLPDYRTNPYVMLATTNIMGLSNPDKFANFLFNSKLAMGLETSFGKIIERSLVGGYPCESNAKWSDPIEKIEEFAEEKKAPSKQAKAGLRSASIWREIDKDVTVGSRRYMTTIKSGPNTINDTQVQGMVDAIAGKHLHWLQQSEAAHPGLEGIDIVIGLTYGTERSTNNKDIQILAKLLKQGFKELDPEGNPGVLVDEGTGRVRVYRKVGQPFWAWIGDPTDEAAHPQVFLEILLALVIAFRDLLKDGSSIEEGINTRLGKLAAALLAMRLDPETLPDWISDEEEISDEKLFYLVTALSAFYDEGI